MRKLILQAMILAAIITGCILLCSPAKAEPADALRLYVGANAVWLDGPGAAWPVDGEVSGNLAASLSPHITLVGGLYYGFANSYVRWDGGPRVTVTDVDNPNFDMFLGLDYRGGSIDAVQPSEWAPYAGVGLRPWPQTHPNWTFGAKSGLGLTSNRTLSTIAIRYMLPVSLFH